MNPKIAEVIYRLRSAVSELMEAGDYPPEKNCSCHLTPPCNDCMDWGHIRAARQAGDDALKASEPDKLQAIAAVGDSRDEFEAGWFLPESELNDLQIASVNRQIERTKQAHHTDLDIRINGQNESHQADWIKHMRQAARSET